MTPLAIISIIYVAINVIGTIVGLVWLWIPFEFPFVYKLLPSSSKRWVQVVLSIFEIVFLTLFIPTITVLALVGVVFMIVGFNFEE